MCVERGPSANHHGKKRGGEERAWVVTRGLHLKPPGELLAEQMKHKIAKQRIFFFAGGGLIYVASSQGLMTAPNPLHNRDPVTGLGPIVPPEYQIHSNDGMYSRYRS